MFDLVAGEGASLTRVNIRVYLLPLLLALLGIVLQVLSETDALDVMLSGVIVAEKVEYSKSIVTILGYVAFVVPLTYQSVVRGQRALLCDKAIEKYIDDRRNVLASILHDNGYITGTSEDFNIRIFKKKGHRLVLENNAGFFSKRIEGRLSFDISKGEGLCVQAYEAKRSMLEIEDASKPKYHLTLRQQALAGGLKFIVAVPIQQDHESKVKYVICFDSFQKIAHSGCEEGILKNCENIAYSIASVME